MRKLITKSVLNSNFLKVTIAWPAFSRAAQIDPTQCKVSHYTTLSNGYMDSVRALFDDNIFPRTKKDHIFSLAFLESV